MSLFNNSAHDDITLTVSDDEYQQCLVELQKLPRGELLVQILSLIKTINEADALGDAQVVNETITLSHERLGAQVKLSHVRIEEQNWQSMLSPHENDPYDNMEVTLTAADKKALSEGDFDIEFVKAAPEPCLSLAQLLGQMDLYATGRPSTYARVLTDLADSGLIHFNPTTDCVRLTDKGLKAICTMTEYAPALASASFSAQMQRAFEQIANGFAMPKETILSVYELIHGELSCQDLALKLWSHIEQIYDQNPKNSDLPELSSLITRVPKCSD
jgi:DNA topoisomerase IA